jgi:hypothetical protein
MHTNQAKQSKINRNKMKMWRSNNAGKLYPAPSAPGYINPPSSNYQGSTASKNTDEETIVVIPSSDVKVVPMSTTTPYPFYSQPSATSGPTEAIAAPYNPQQLYSQYNPQQQYSQYNPQQQYSQYNPQQQYSQYNPQQQYPKGQCFKPKSNHCHQRRGC